MSDREKAGLRGPVRTCVEEAILPDNIKHLTTREYSEDSKLLYSYQYDSYGNWVEQTINHGSRADEPLSVNRRTLTYY